nr:S16 family serine protease [Kineosphaera limosa]
MAGSQHNAAAVALRAIGKPEQAVVAQVLADGPAAGRLHADDIVLAVNGTAVTRASQVSSLIQEGGSTATLRVRRSGQEIDVAVPTRIDQGRRMVGIGLEAKFDDSIDVAIDAGNVGGPSAGMMFALAVYDKVTPGPLTGGQKIAGTGTVGIDGAVGPIGGITHKLVGAADAGATWFLAPAADCAEVVGNIPDGLQVAKVATFDEARQAVEQIGAGQGDRVPTCTP